MKAVLTKGLAGIFLAATLGLAHPGWCQEDSAQAEDSGTEEGEVEPEAMTSDRLLELARRLDSEASAEGNSIQFELLGRTHIFIHDEQADRMRLISPIAQADVLSEALMYRLLQANYDSALDARYAVANDIVWSVFIHPLASLSDEQVISAVSQVYTAAETFGSTFSSGAMIFEGGDSQPLLEELEKALQDILQPTT